MVLSTHTGQFSLLSQARKTQNCFYPDGKPFSLSLAGQSTIFQLSDETAGIANENSQFALGWALKYIFRDEPAAVSNNRNRVHDII